MSMGLTKKEEKSPSHRSRRGEPDEAAGWRKLRCKVGSSTSSMCPCVNFGLGVGEDTGLCQRKMMQEK